MDPLLCVDIGSTFTKGLLVDLETGSAGELAAVPTTIKSDVLDGLDAVASALGAGRDTRTLVCSSAGGGLRLAVVGYEDSVTTLAGHRVGLSAGARVVHVASGPLDAAAVRGLRAARPDVVLLVGGTDGGNAEVLLHNARRLASARLRSPIVFAGNREGRDAATAALASTQRTVYVADNVLPRIGTIAPASARAAIREVFLRHVIGGKHLSRGPRLASLVRMATPDAVLRGLEVVGEAGIGDVLAIDIGGATTDVYSVLGPSGAEARGSNDAVPEARYARTVEADLGMRWNVTGIVEAAEREALPLSDATVAYAARVAREVGSVPATPAEWAADLELAAAAAVVAARRHGRAERAGLAARPLGEVALLLGSGGVLRHGPDGAADGVLRRVLADRGGAWLVPRRARTATDSAYVLFAVGLLATENPQVAAVLAGDLIQPSA